MIVTFLQNAWFHRPLFEGFERDANGKAKRGSDGNGIPILLEPWSPKWRRVWIYATAISRSGARLRVMLGRDCFEREDMAFADASPKVSYGNSAGRFDGDPEWVASELTLLKPTVVVCCGNEAIDTVTPVWHGPVVCVPHPTSRVVTNALYADAGALLLKPGFHRRVRFYQHIGGHGVQDLPAIAALQ
jgi:hypothetical protein